MWFATSPTELDFTSSSPYQLAFDASIEATPRRVFEIFTKGEAQDKWFQDFKACRWTSADPHAVGTTREIELKMLTVKERFVAWGNFVGDVVAAQAELVRHDEIKPYATALLGHSEGGLLALAGAGWVLRKRSA